MTTRIILPDNATSGSVPLPSAIQQAELVINTADGRLFTKNSSGQVVLLNAKSTGGSGAGFPYEGDAVITGSLYVSGTDGSVTAVVFNSLSDREQKTDIVPITGSLELLHELHGVRFHWKSTHDASAGLIAQDVESVMPELVSNRDDGKVLNYNGIIGVLVEAVKSLSRRVAELERDRI
jgi:hypothetical protein